MINYYFDNENELKPYAFQAEANEGSFAPDNASRIEPEFKEGYYPCFKFGKWVLIEDHRGKTSYNIETKEKAIIDYIGEIKDGFTLLEPLEFSKWNGKEWIIDDILKNEAVIEYNQSTKEILLAESNRQITILQDAIDLDLSEVDDEDKLKTWKKYRILLNRIDTNQLNIEWPKKPQ